MEKVVIHHSEIGLKKGNFSYFERKLMQNIRRILKKNGIEVVELKRHDKRIFGVFEGAKETIRSALMNVFGIKYFSFVEEIEKSVESIEKKVRSILENVKKEGHHKISFSTKRGDKKFTVNSIELNKKLGEISNSLGLKVDYKNANQKIFIEIPSSNTVYIYGEKILGLGGLPVSTGGRVLCLLSGGIDSPVATWLMMKRGCRVDFIHFHTSPTNKKGFDSKIKKTVEILNKYQIKSKLYLVPYSLYETFIQGNVSQRYDVNLFKNYILKVTEKLVAEKKYDGIVTGDNLAQVASQTMSNLKATSLGISEIIFRPLLTYDKQEIINLAHKIETFDISVEKYKDCCSIIAKNPATKTKTEIFAKIIDETKIDELVEKSLKEVEEFKVD
jgi:tRNA uracil 4-sulfurtransferase